MRVYDGKETQEKRQKFPNLFREGVVTRHKWKEYNQL